MYYGYGYFWDPTYFLVIIGIIICVIASARVHTTYNRYARVRSSAGMTGAQAAERVLHHMGIYDVQIVHVGGNLTDHYDPRNKQLALSDTVYGSTSVAAIGVAAHECGHAVQHARGYVPLRIRGAMVPVVNFGSSLSWIFIVAGIAMMAVNPNTVGPTVCMIGVILFSLSVLFQLVTLPVEFNASHRALKILNETQILNPDELKDTRKVLSAAAMTYVAAAAAGLLQLLRLLLIFGNVRDN